MNILNCEKCGGAEFVKRNGATMCCYCRSMYSRQNTAVDATIALDDDVQRLLKKCRSEPHKAHRYASLVLDIDPTNAEALRYL